jgi:hypothetical protein
LNYVCCCPRTDKIKSITIIMMGSAFEENINRCLVCLAVAACNNNISLRPQELKLHLFKVKLWTGMCFTGMLND